MCSFVQLRICVDEGMLWFLECLPYFIVDDLILLFVALVELLGLRMSSSVGYEDFGVCA
jgi:hypothetical protein